MDSFLGDAWTWREFLKDKGKNGRRAKIFFHGLSRAFIGNAISCRRRAAPHAHAIKTNRLRRFGMKMNGKDIFLSRQRIVRLQRLSAVCGWFGPNWAEFEPFC
jgi:hypothetical protein